jgi:hypothetical protein
MCSVSEVQGLISDFTFRLSRFIAAPHRLGKADTGQSGHDRHPRPERGPATAISASSERTT